MPRLDEIKAQGRRRLHELAAVSCDLVDPTHPNGLDLGEDYEGDGLLVRYHNKINTSGDLENQGYGEVIDGIDRLVFNDENVAEVSAALVENGEAALVLSRNAEVTIPAYKGLKFILDSREPADGPLETIWIVARARA